MTSQQQQPPALGLGLPARQLSISTSASQSQRSTLTPPQTSPVRSKMQPSVSASLSQRTTSSSTVSPSSVGATTPVTAPPESAHVPGLGEDCFLDLIGLPTPPPSVRARAGSVGVGRGRAGSNPAPPQTVEVVSRAPRARLENRWKPIEYASDEESAEARTSEELNDAHLRALQELAEGTIDVEGAHGLRGSHSFDSVLTARVHTPVDAQSPESEHTPTCATPAPGTEAVHDPKHPEKSFIASYPTVVFDVLQTYDGSKLSSPRSRAKEPAPFAQGDAVNPLPPDDPRFILWSTPAVSPPTSTPPRESAFPNVQQPAPTGPVRRTLLACTLERWIAQLTSSLDYDILLDTLISYRPFLPPAALARLLITRFMWTLQSPPSWIHPSDVQRHEVVRKIVRLRTILVMRCWLQVFFRVDFVHNKDARDVLIGWMNRMEREPEIQARDDVLKLVRRLKRIVRECKDAYSRDVQMEFELGMKDSPAAPSAAPLPPARVNGSGNPVPIEEKDTDDIDLSDLSPRPSVDYDRLAGRSAAEEYAHLATYGKPNPSSKARESIRNLADFVPAAAPPEQLPVLIPNSTAAAAPPSLDAEPPSGLGLDLDDAADADEMNQLVPSSPSSHQGTGTRNALSRAMGKLKRAVAGKSGPVSAVGAACTGSEAAKAFLEDTPGLVSAAMMAGRVDSPPPPPVPKKDVRVSLVPAHPPMLAPPQAFEPQPEVVDPPQEASFDQQVPEPVQLEQAPEPVYQEQAAEPTYNETAPEPAHDEAVAEPVALAESAYEESLLESDLGEVIPSMHDDTIHAAEVREAEGRTSEEFTPSLTPASPTSSEPVESSGVWEKRMADQQDEERDAHAEGSEAFSTLSIGTDGWQQESMTSLESGAGGHAHGLGGNAPPHVISLDDWDSDLDLDSSDEDERPAQRAPKRLPRRLPLRRELDERPISTASVSSLGIRSLNDRDSIISATFPVLRERERELGPRNPLLEGPLTTWQLELIGSYLERVGDDTEAGDAAAALAKLEGQIDRSRQAQHWKRADEFIEQAAVIAQNMLEEKLASDRAFLERNSLSSTTSHRNTIGVHPASASPEKANRSPTKAPAPARPHASSIGGVSPLPVIPPAPSYPMNHVSLIFAHGSTELAEAFCLIDCEMTLAIRFEEILLLEWYGRVQAEPDVLDWASFIKARALVRYDLQQRRKQLQNMRESAQGPDCASASIPEGSIRKLSDIAAIKVRFNLMVHWVAHEILLTHPSRRVELVNKIIRIAYKAYRMNSFATVVPIVAGLRSPEANIAMRKLWGRVGAWEMKLLTALKEFCTPEDSFKYIRAAVSRVIQEPRTATAPTSVRATLAANGRTRSSPTTCVPFLGVYVSQMQHVSRMPDYIDPTDPPNGVRFNTATNQFYPLKNPDRFADLEPLPPSVQLEPLINVEKARMLADIVRNFVAGQHLAINMRFPEMNHSLWKECMSIRRLPSDEVNARLMAE